MGMFDTIIFSRDSLSNIDERVDKYLSLIGDSEIAFQTKDFDCLLSTYKVQNNQLFYRIFERKWVESGGMFGGYMEEVSSSLEKQDKTATIYAYDSLENDVADIWIEFKVIFINGVVDKIELFKFEETCPKSRLEREKNLLQEMKEYQDYKKTIRGKIAIFFKDKIHRFLNKISKTLRKLAIQLDKLNFKIKL